MKTSETMMRPGLRKCALTAHVTSSVGWMGAIASFLALAIAGLLAADEQLVRAAYLATKLITWYVIVPFGFASLLTGLVQSLGTSWGLFRHYWIIAKSVIGIAATLLLLLHTQAVERVAAAAAATALSPVDLRPVRIQLVGDAGAAFLVLVVATTLSVYKPWGLTAHGRRQVRGLSDQQRASGTTPTWLYVAWACAILFVAFVVVMHLTGRGLGSH